MHLSRYCFFSAVILVSWITFAFSSDSDELIDDIKELLEILSDQQRHLKNVLKEMIDYVQKNKNDENIVKIKKVVEKLKTTAPVLEDSKVSDLRAAQAFIDTLLSITENLPFIGTASAVIRNALAGLFSLFGGYMSERSIDDVVMEAVREVADDELVEKVHGSQEVLSTIIDYFRPKLNRTLQNDEVITLNNNMYDGVSTLEMVSTRIAQRSVSGVKREAEQSVTFVTLYCQLFTLRDLVYKQMMTLAANAGDDNEVKSFESVRQGKIKSAQSAVRFLTKPQVKNGLALTFFYPTGVNLNSFYIQSCLRYLQLHEEGPTFKFAGKVIWISSKAYPEWYIARSSSGIRGGKGRDNSGKLILENTGGDYWTLSTGFINAENPKLSLYHEGEYLGYDTGGTGDQYLFTVIQLPGNHFVLSPKNRPGNVVYNNANDKIRVGEGGQEGREILLATPS